MIKKKRDEEDFTTKSTKITKEEELKEKNESTDFVGVKRIRSKKERRIQYAPKNYQL
ncbi:MAG: hypothetical protein WC155_02620 [Candidatus Cloacimonadales bacterium]